MLDPDPLEKTTPADKLPFLRGGGEMGEYIRRYDWSKTSIGSPEQWPSPLRTTLSILLNSRFPMFLWWGPDLIQFYNDAYRPSLGDNGKHPTALGQKGEACWPEIWPDLAPLINQIMSGGEAIWHEDQRVPIYRTGQLEDVYWTFGYSAVCNEAGQPAGVLVVCTETTTAVTNRRKLEASEARFRLMFEQAPVAIGLLRGEDLIVETANRKVLEILHKPASIIGKPWFEAMPELRGQPAETIIKDVYRTGVPFTVTEFPAHLDNNGKLELGYYTFSYLPLTEQGTVTGILQVAVEVTDQVVARRVIEESEARFRSLIDEAPVATCLFVGRDLRIDVANEPMITFFGRGRSILGKSAKDVLTASSDQSALALLEEVFATGKPHQALGAPAELTIGGVPGTYYFDFSLKPLHNETGEVYAILEMAIEVTQEVRSKQALARSETHFRRLTDTVPAIIWTTETDGSCTYLNKQWYDFTGQTPAEAEGFGWLDATHPDDKAAAGRLFVEANSTQVPFQAHYRLRRRDGNYRWCIDLGSPRFGAEGAYEGMTGTVVDVHDQKVAEAEQQKLAAIIHSSHEFIGMASLDAAIQYCNPAALAMLGWNDSTGKYIQDFVYPDDRPLADRLIGELLETGEISHEIRFVNAQTGKPFWLQWNGFTIKNAGTGNIVAMATVSPNITARKQADQALKESEERFQAAIVAVEGILWTNNATGEMAGYQPGWAALTGQTYDEYQGYGWSSAVHPDDAQPTVDAWHEAVRDRRTFVFEHRVRQYNGHWGLFSIRATPLLNADGQVREWVGVHTDITEPRRAAQALADSEARYRSLSDELDQQVQQRTAQLQASILDLQRSNANLQQFAYVASHDLQEPLRKIQSFGDLLMNRYADRLSDGVDHLERMQTAASRMSTLIRDLLAYSRISTQQNTTAPVSLMTVVDTALADLDLLIEETGAGVTVDPLPIVLGDAPQLSQLFQNLLSNALKFRRINTDTKPRIRISCQTLAAADLPTSIEPTRPTETYYRIDVTDNGIGFDEKYLDRIFQVFQRLNGRSQYTGTGIGLAICEKVVANHGGAITASSQPGQGATFSVYLPH